MNNSRIDAIQNACSDNGSCSNRIMSEEDALQERERQLKTEAFYAELAASARESLNLKTYKHVPDVDTKLKRERAMIKSMLEGGNNLKSIAFFMSCSCQAITRFCIQQFGQEWYDKVMSREYKHQLRLDEHREKILDYADKGYSTQLIGNLCGLHQTTVVKYLKEYREGK